MDFLTLTFWVFCGVKFKGFLGLKVRSYHWARRAGSKISFRRREDASSPPQRRSVATPRRREQYPQRRRSVAASQHRENAKTRAAPQRRGSVAKTRRREETPATWQRREDAKTRGDPSGVAASQHRSVATPRRREQPPQRRRSDHGVPQLHIRKSKRECLAFFLAKFSLMTPSAMPSDFPEAKNLLVLQSSSSSKILL